MKRTYIFHASKNREAEMRLTRLLRRNTSNHVCAIGQRFLYMESALPQNCMSNVLAAGRENINRIAGKTLAKDFGILCNKKVVDCVGVTLSSSRLGERPASG